VLTRKKKSANFVYVVRYISWCKSFPFSVRCKSFCTGPYYFLTTYKTIYILHVLCKFDISLNLIPIIYQGRKKMFRDLKRLIKSSTKPESMKIIVFRCFIIAISLLALASFFILLFVKMVNELPTVTSTFTAAKSVSSPGKK
jgi:hypothetical protein